MKQKLNFLSRLIPLIALLFMLPTAMWGEQWVKTDFTSLTTSDVFVIAELTNAKALSNKQITPRNAAAALAVTFNSDKSEIISTSVTDKMKWKFENSTVTNEFYLKTADNGYYLSFQNSNTGLVINTAKTSFHMESKTKSSTTYNYITGSDGSNTRYLNLYNNTDWRCYKSSALVVTNVAFFKLVDENHTLSSIVLSGTYPTSFNKGDAFSHEGMTVTAKYEEQGVEDANVTAKATFSGYDMNQAGNQTVTVSYTEGAVTKTETYNITVTAVPVISASNVDIEANATSGEITLSITDPVDGASITASTTADWISSFDYTTAGKVAFTTSANTGAARNATVTLSYKKDDETLATKVVTVSQYKAMTYITYDKIDNKATAIIGGTYVWLAAYTANNTTTYYYTKDFEGSNTYFNATALAQDSRVTETQAKLTDENALTFSIDMKADGWTIVNGSNKVLAITADKKIAWKDVENDKPDFYVWTINDDASFQMATTYNSNTTYKMLYNYNSGSPRVNAYSATNKYPAATLYHLASESAHTLSLVIDGETTKTYNIKDGYTWKLPTIDDGDFLGWATTPGGSVAYANGADYTMPASNATLYAKRSVETQTVYLVDNNNIWQTASAKFAVYYGEGESFTNGGWSEFMTEDCATNHVYSVEIPETATYVSFKRLASDAETPATGTVWTDAGNHALDNGKACWVYSDNGTWKYSYNASPYYSIAGNGGADATKAWMNGENWEPVSLGCDNYVTFVNVPAGNWTLKSIGQDGTWSNAISKNNTAKNVTLTNDDDKNIILYTDRTQDITISYDNGLKFVGTFGYYTVAGAEDLTGENWNYASEANRMTWDAEKSLYVLEKNVSLTAGSYEYRVGVNGTYNPQYPSEYNASTEITEDGIYNVTFTYNPSDDAVAVTCTKLVATVTPSAESINVHSEKSDQGSAAFTITGENLTDDLTLSFADEVDGLNVSPTTIKYESATLASTTITVSYQSMDETSGSTTLNIKQGESILASVTVNYTSTAFLTEITDVTSAMTWDFSGYTTDVTTERTEEVVLANYIELTTGDASMLKGKQQYIVRKSYCWQGTQLTFHPTVPGTVTVVWSSTASNNYRTLAIGDEKIVAAGSNSTSASGGVTTTRVVPANQDVVLTGWNVSGTAPNYEYTSNQIRIWSLKFTPAVTVSTAQYATYYHADYSYVMPEGLEGIVVSAQTGTALTLDVMYTADGANGTEKVVPAGEPLILHATTNLTSDETFVLEPGTTTQSSCKELDMNLLSGTSAADEETTGGAPYYRLSVHGGKVGFYWGAEGGAAFKPGANKAYLALNGASAPDRFVFNPSTPIVTGVDETLNKYVKSGKTLVNGKLYIVRENKVFDFSGRLVNTSIIQ